MMVNVMAQIQPSKLPEGSDDFETRPKAASNLENIHCTKAINECDIYYSF